MTGGFTSWLRQYYLFILLVLGMKMETIIGLREIQGLSSLFAFL